jgi:hypothetical protein
LNDGLGTTIVHAGAPPATPVRSVEVKMKVAFAGSFAASIAEPVRARLALPHELVVGDETAIVGQLADVDVLVSMEDNMPSIR